MSERENEDAAASLASARLAIGFAQGVAAWLLIRSVDRPWSARHSGVFAALVLLAAFPPLIPLAALGHMRRRTLLLWTIAASILVAILAAYDLWRDPLMAYAQANETRRWPSPQVIGFSAVALYVAHHLIEPADVERRWWPSYRLRFESAWRHGFQLVLSLTFAGLFWLVLQLGAALFDVIGVKWVGETIHKSWFASPATATAFAAAVHLTDVKPNLIKGVRGVGLTLLAWLAPVACGLTAAFLLTLPFTGVDKLWATRRATPLLLSAAGLLIVLLNAAYQDGREREGLAAVLRWTVRAAGLLLVPLVLLAAWATLLRIGQYGLTPERTVGVALLLVAAVYAGGYAWAAVSRGPWMQRLEPVNVWAALLMVTLILALLSPIADPARLSTTNQLHRLTSGRIAANRFDFTFFRFRAARFGRDALTRLASSHDTALAVQARKAQALTLPWMAGAVEPEVQEPPFSHADILPAGTSLPEGFRRQDWTTDSPPVVGASCLTSGVACDLIVRDIDGDGRPKVLLSTRSSLAAYGQGADGRWRRLGEYTGAACPGVFEGLQAGRPDSVARSVQDLRVAGQWLAFEPEDQCKTAPPKPATKPEPQRPPPELGPAFNQP